MVTGNCKHMLSVAIWKVEGTCIPDGIMELLLQSWTDSVFLSHCFIAECNKLMY